MGKCVKKAQIKRWMFYACDVIWSSSVRCRCGLKMGKTFVAGEPMVASTSLCSWPISLFLCLPWPGWPVAEAGCLPNAATVSWTPADSAQAHCSSL